MTPDTHPEVAAAVAIDMLIAGFEHRPSVVEHDDFYFARCTCGIKTLGWQTPERAERALQQMHEAKRRIEAAAR